MLATATTGAAASSSPVYLAPRLETGCDVSDRLLAIVANSGKSAQQRVSEAVAFAATRGWETCAVFALAPDLIREVELRCNQDKHKRLMLSIIDAEDGNERLQISYASRRHAWDRII